MKHTARKLLLSLVLVVILIGSLPITAYAAAPSDIVIGNNYTLNSGESLNDDLFIMGGNVTLATKSTVNGNIVLLGGNIQAAGTVNGDLIVLGGSVNLADTFTLHGNLSSAGASVNRAPGATITGNIYTERNAPQIFTIPGGIRLDRFSGGAQPLLGVAGFFLRLFVWVLLATLAAMFIPSHMTRVTKTAMGEPIASGGIGLLTAIVAPIILVVLAITICLIPIALLGAFSLAVAWAYGLISFGLEVGRRIAQSFNRQWHPALMAALGTLVLMLVLNGVEAVLPCIGWLPKAVVGLFGLGAVLLTQFGTKPYPISAPPVLLQPGEALPPVDDAVQQPIQGSSDNPPPQEQS